MTILHEYPDYENDNFEPFADPGGKSALRAGKRIYPCPTCGKPNSLTAADKRHHYQCDDCADRAEGTYMGGDY